MNVVSAPQSAPTRPPPKRLRFSLQTLFFLSFLLVSPFFAAAFAGGNFNASYAAVAPMLLILGVAFVGIATMVGLALGNRRGAILGALTAGALWIALAVLGMTSLVLTNGRGSVGAFLLHCVAATICTGGVCYWLGRQREPDARATDSSTFARLRSVKQAALAGRTPHHDDNQGRSV